MHNPPLVRNGRGIAPEGDDYYFTDAISSEAVRQIRQHAASQPDRPFFQYLAYTAPHWPLHAHPEDIEKYKGRFDGGWDRLREERLARMINMGLVPEGSELTARDPSQPPWVEAEHKAWQTRRMEVYAAQIDRMDQGIGCVLNALAQTGQMENTLILFLADNGGCAEELNQGWAFLRGQKTRDGRDVQLGNDPAVMHASGVDVHGIWLYAIALRIKRWIRAGVFYPLPVTNIARFRPSPVSESQSLSVNA